MIQEEHETLNVRCIYLHVPSKLPVNWVFGPTKHDPLSNSHLKKEKPTPKKGFKKGRLQKKQKIPRCVFLISNGVYHRNRIDVICCCQNPNDICTRYIFMCIYTHCIYIYI